MKVWNLIEFDAEATLKNQKNSTKMIRKYLLELVHLKAYIFAIVLVIVASYSVYFFCDQATVANLGDEDHFFEWWTAISLLGASILCFILFRNSKNIFFILLAFIFFFGGGEEISWGQRLIGFKNPEMMEKLNVQEEFSFHNLEMFNTVDFKGNKKHGFARLLEVNFLFRVFMMVYGIVLPFVVFHFKKISSFTQAIKLPVPPIGIGIFFLVNWIAFWLIYQQISMPGNGLKYVGADAEIFECIGAFIFLSIFSFFYINRAKTVMGQDIKNYLFEIE